MTKKHIKAKQLVKKKRPLTIKQRKFIDEVVKSWNATDAASKVYKTKNRRVANAIGNENLAKPSIKDKIEERVNVAKNIIYWIAVKEDEKSDTRIKACQDIIDRVEWKAKQRIEWDIDWNLLIKIVNYGINDTP